MSKNIRQQITYAVRSNFKENFNKHSLQKAGVRNDGIPKSYNSLNAQLDVSKQFGKWEMTMYPEVRMACNIPLEHFQQWLNERAASGEWHHATLVTKMSELKAIIKNMGRAFGREDDSYKLVMPAVEEEMKQKIRDKAMDRTDIQKIRELCKPEETIDKAIAISQAFGLRSEEISRLKAENIEIYSDYAVCHVLGAKNGKNYDVKCIDSSKIADIAKIKNEKKEGYIFTSRNDKNRPMKPDSIQKSLWRAMDKVDLARKYEKTGFHALRKEWAQRQYDIYRKNHGIWETRAFVSQQLGHSDQRGEDEVLMKRYVENIH